MLYAIPARAQEQRYSQHIGAFDKLTILNDVSVRYRNVPDSIGYIAFNADNRNADQLLFTNNGGHLRIETMPEDTIAEAPPMVYVYSTVLTSVEASTDGVVTIEKPMPGTKLSITAIGNSKVLASGLDENVVEAKVLTGIGEIILEGKCASAKFQMVGNGVIQADRLKAQKVDCKILGSGTIGCWAVSKLNLHGIGSTKVYYKGDPSIKKIGGGKLYPLDF